MNERPVRAASSGGAAQVPFRCYCSGFCRCCRVEQPNTRSIFASFTCRFRSGRPGGIIEGVADTLAAGRPEQEQRSMATHPKTDRPIRFEDKEELRRLMDAFNERIGFVPDPDPTPEKVQELMRANG